MLTWPTSVALASLAALLIAAVATDLRSRRIPNRLVLAGIALAFAIAALALASGARRSRARGPGARRPAWSPASR
jgi:Flp pilus assembly protein protease CpaA